MAASGVVLSVCQNPESEFVVLPSPFNVSANASTGNTLAGNFLPSSFPIIAPPKGYKPMPSLSVESHAKIRIKYFLEREHRAALRDFVVSSSPQDTYLSKDGWENRLGIEANLRREIVSWLLTVCCSVHVLSSFTEQPK